MNVPPFQHHRRYHPRRKSIGIFEVMGWLFGIAIVLAAVYWLLSGWLVLLMVMAGIKFLDNYNRKKRR